MCTDALQLVTLGGKPLSGDIRPYVHSLRTNLTYVSDNESSKFLAFHSSYFS